jgi:hypothetical protein
MGDGQSKAAEFLKPDFDGQFVVVSGGREEVHSQGNDRKDVIFFLEAENRIADRAHEFAASGFEDVEVTGVVDVVPDCALGVDDALAVAEDFRHAISRRRRDAALRDAGVTQSSLEIPRGPGAPRLCAGFEGPRHMPLNAEAEAV